MKEDIEQSVDTSSHSDECDSHRLTELLKHIMIQLCKQ